MLTQYRSPTPGVIVGGIFFASDKLLWMVECAVRSGPDLIDYSRFEVDVNGTRDVLSGTSLGEKRVEGVITAPNGLVGRHLAIGLYSML